MCRPRPTQVRTWLSRIHDAANRNNFQGTFVVSGTGVVSSSRITHFCEGGNQFERIESLDGQLRHVLRHNDSVQTVWPARKIALIEQRDPAGFVSLAAPRERRPHQRVLRDLRAAPPIGWRVARRASCGSSPRMCTASAIGCGQTGSPGCCCGPTCWAATRGAGDVGLFRRRDRRQVAARMPCCRR